MMGSSTALRRSGMDRIARGARQLGNFGTQRLGARAARRTLLFVLNPRRGEPANRRLVDQARTELGDFELEFLEPWDTRQIAAARARLGTRCAAIVVAGGDGTLNRALPALLRSRVPAFVLPVGTANDVARQLQISGAWAQMRHLLDTDRVRHIDVLFVNGRPFVSVGGIGVGAALCARVQERRARSRAFRFALRSLRAATYTLFGIETILRDRACLHRVCVTGGGRRFEMRTGLLMVCNQAKLAGDLRLVPQTRNDDGIFDLVAMPITGRRQLLGALARMKSARTHPAATHWHCQRLRIEDLDDRPMTFFGDGEILAQSSTLDIRIAREALAVLAP